MKNNNKKLTDFLLKLMSYLIRVLNTRTQTIIHFLKYNYLYTKSNALKY